MRWDHVVFLDRWTDLRLSSCREQYRKCRLGPGPAFGTRGSGGTRSVLFRIPRLNILSNTAKKANPYNRRNMRIRCTVELNENANFGFRSMRKTPTYRYPDFGSELTTVVCKSERGAHAFELAKISKDHRRLSWSYRLS
jgi:hypothetical protein